MVAKKPKKATKRSKLERANAKLRKANLRLERARASLQDGRRWYKEELARLLHRAKKAEEVYKSRNSTIVILADVFASALGDVQRRTDQTTLARTLEKLDAETAKD